MTKDIRPFLSFVTTQTRSLGSALPAIATPDVTSPWLPRSTTSNGHAAGAMVSGPSSEELARTLDEARERGRAEGLAETAALRERLAALVAAVHVARGEVIEPAVELVAELASCVVEAWVGCTEQTVLFAPVIRGWLERSPTQPATVRVHPADAAALTGAIGEAPLAIAADPELARGALEISSATLELSHDWRARLAELQTAIVAALTGAGDEEDEPGHSPPPRVSRADTSASARSALDGSGSAA